MQETAVLTLAAIGVVAIFCQWLAWRVRLPAILFLLCSGVILGPATGWLQPDALFGDLLFPLISLSVAVILFEGSLSLNFAEIKGLRDVVRRLTSVGALITWAVVAVVTRELFALSWELSILFGALMIVTGPTVIVPLLRTVRPSAPVASVLRWEGIMIDPIGALLVVVVYEFIITSGRGQALGHSLALFAEITVVGLALGSAGGWSLGQILRRHLLPDFLLNLATLSMVFAVFALANHLAHESGLLAVTIMGMWLANTRDIRIHEILNFKENLTVLLISGLFILLAARLDAQQVLSLGWAPLLLLIVVQFIARPLSVLASTVGSSLSWRERALLAWIAPRGIVAAAVSALFAIRLQEAGFARAELLVSLTFIVIIGTVVLQSATSRQVAKWLDVAEPAPRGFLIIGANNVARSIAEALQKQDVDVLLTDTSWENIRQARMAGLKTFYGNPVSDYADQRMDMAGLGKLLALSPQRDTNVIGEMHYRSEFGQQNIYTLLTSAETKGSEKHRVAATHRGYSLFDAGLTYGKFASLLSQQAEVRRTKLSDEFSFEDFMRANQGKVIPLFAISPRGRVEVFVVGGELKPEAGWTLISLMTEPGDSSERGAGDEGQRT